MTITGGTGAGTASGDSKTGEDLYANIYSLGTIESTPSPQIYVFQSGSAIPEWSHLSNWDRGHIDILVQVKEAGTEIDGAVVTVFARQYGDLYDNYEIDLSAGGRNAVPLATSDDLNNATGEYYLLFDNKSGSPFAANNIIWDEISGASAEIISVHEGGTSGYLSLGGINGTFYDNCSLSSNGAFASANGWIGDTLLQFDASTSSFQTTGQVLYDKSNGARRIVTGIQNYTGSGLIVCKVDENASGSAKTAFHRSFSDNDEVSGATDGDVTLSADSSTLVAGYSDITIAFMNGSATYVSSNGTTATEYERIQWSSSGNAILLKDEGNTLYLGNVTYSSLNGKWFVGDLSGISGQFSQDLQISHTLTRNFQLGNPHPYDVHVNCGDIYVAGRGLADVYEYFKFVTRENSTFPMYTASGSLITVLDGEEYIQAYPGYSPVKASPFGTFAGGVLFGAQGVWVEGMASTDSQNFQLIDSSGNTRTPPNFVTIKITSVASGDRVSVFKLSGASSTVIDKWMYYPSGDTFNQSGSTKFVVSGTLSTDVPAAGVIRCISGNQENRYGYTSWVSSNMFLLSDPLVTNYKYSNGDSVYIPYIDQTATSDTVEQSVIYSTDRKVLTRVRRYNGAGDSIIPFEVAGTVGTAGLTVPAIRTADTIVT